MNRASNLAAVLAMTLAGGLGGLGPMSRPADSMKREPQPPRKQSSNRKALLLEAALRRKARWER